MSTPLRVSSVPNVWRRTWLVTWSSSPVGLVIAPMTSAIASVIILVPRLEDIADAVGHINSTVTKAVYRHVIADEITSAATAMDAIFGDASGS
jgi:hypothetical protein